MGSNQLRSSAFFQQLFDTPIAPLWGWLPTFWGCEHTFRHRTVRFGFDMSCQIANFEPKCEVNPNYGQ